MVKTIYKNLNTKPKLIGAGVLSLVLSYAFALRAIDTARYWQYLMAIILLVMGLKFLTRSLKSNGNK